MSSVAVGAAAVVLPRAGSAASEAGVLRIAPQSELKIIDPIFTTSGVTQNHALMIYDTLFSIDENYRPQPQMVKEYSQSEDQLTWTFTLRDGLEFHDGSKVTTKDVIASLKRWAAKAADGKILLSRLDRIEAVDDVTFSIILKERFGGLLESFAMPASSGFYVMREKEANVSHTEQIQEAVGSGPFIFEQSKWVPGGVASYVRNPKYVPRDEPPSGLAGGKLPKVDKVELTYLPDSATAAAALLNQEVDLVEVVAYDLMSLFDGSETAELRVLDRMGYKAYIRPNSAIPPFNNPLARQALLYLADQEEYLPAMVGYSEFERKCGSPLMCNGPIKFPEELAVTPNLQRAKELFEQAGYDGRPIIIMSPSDMQNIAAMSEVTASRLKSIGINVDVQVMDFATLSSRRTSKADPAAGGEGWHIFHSWGQGTAFVNPINMVTMSTACDGQGFPGWPCDEGMQGKIRAFLDTDGEEAVARAARELAEDYYNIAPFIPLGEFTRPAGVSKRLTGVVNAPMLAVWNIEKS